jgi:hypothetical protein
MVRGKNFEEDEPLHLVKEISKQLNNAKMMQFPTVHTLFTTCCSSNIQKIAAKHIWYRHAMIDVCLLGL